MKKSLVPYLVAGIVLLGILAGAIWFQTLKDSEQYGGGGSSAGITTTTSSPDVTTTTGPDGAITEPAPQPSPTPKATNMNPDLSVDANGLSKATVTLTTTKGVVKFKFYSNDAPNTVKRLVELINKGFYNGLTFHRVVPGFVIQGGDPEGTGRGGSGKNLKAEFNKRRHSEGTLAMARAADPDSADSQFYITLGPQPHLDGSYTAFGQVIEGMDVVRRIQVGDAMTSVTIE